MNTGVVSRAVGAAATLRDAHSNHAFEHSLGDFLQALGSVPDEAAHDVSAQEVGALQKLGEDVIDAIEAKVEGEPASRRSQSLVAQIYEIRRLLEEVYLWRQHYTTARRL
jgi:hypothetical protein